MELLGKDGLAFPDCRLRVVALWSPSTGVAWKLPEGRVVALRTRQWPQYYKYSGRSFGISAPRLSHQSRWKQNEGDVGISPRSPLWPSTSSKAAKAP